jgi:excisionase family DNA binding protein
MDQAVPDGPDGQVLFSLEGHEMDSTPVLLRVDEVARLLQISRSLAYQLVASGALPAVRLGARQIRIPSAALDAWLFRRGAARPQEARQLHEARALAGNQDAHRTVVG